MRTLAAVGIWIVVAIAPAISLAQDAGGQDQSAAESRSASFQAVEGSDREEISGGALLLGAYGSILVLIIGYVGWIAMLQERTTRDLARLRTSIERGASIEQRASKGG